MIGDINQFLAVGREIVLQRSAKLKGWRVGGVLVRVVGPLQWEPPGERVEIESVGRCWQLLKAVLRSLAVVE